MGAGVGVGAAAGAGVGTGLIALFDEFEELGEAFPWLEDGLDGASIGLACVGEVSVGEVDGFTGVVAGSACFGTWPYVMPQKRARIAKSSVVFFILLLFMICVRFFT